MPARKRKQLATSSSAYQGKCTRTGSKKPRTQNDLQLEQPDVSEDVKLVRAWLLEHMCHRLEPTHGVCNKHNPQQHRSLAVGQALKETILELLHNRKPGSSC